MEKCSEKMDVSHKVHINVLILLYATSRSENAEWAWLGLPRLLAEGVIF